MKGPTYTLLHRDECVVIVDKAAGVLTVQHPGTTERCLLDDLRRDGMAVAPVHRLDRETSGVLLLCLDKTLRKPLEQAFRKRQVQKTYLALVSGCPSSPKATIDLPILDHGATAKVNRRGRPAVTHYEVLESFAPRAALVRLTMATGRHNQIRVHMAHLGHPLLGDRKYGRRGKGGTDEARRSMLHAESLALDHPAGGPRLKASCSPPPDFAEQLERLKTLR